MKISAASPVLQVKNLQAALAFYRDVLGFTEDFRYDDYAGIHRDELCLHLCAHAIWKRPVGGSAISIFCDEVDQYCADIKARGATIRSEPADQYYGLRDFVISDPDGNVLTFGCDMPDDSDPTP
jgi:uncharacterized glyoxalase superfamily protein PhnB